MERRALQKETARPPQPTPLPTLSKVCRARGDDPIEVNGMRGRECLGVGRARRRLKHGFLVVVL